MTGWVLRKFSAAWTRLGQRRDLLLEFIALHHQLAVLQRTGTPRPCFRPSERLFGVLLSRWWANWQRSLIIVQPATVLRWRRLGLCAICLSGSCGHWRGGRLRINSEIRALIVRMSQENFLWGAPRIHGGYPPTQTWRTFLRNQAFAIGTIGLGEAGRLSDELLALVRGWIELVVRCVTKVRNGIPCGFIERSSTLHPVPPYRSSNLTDWRDPHSGSMPVPPLPTALGGRTHWTMAGRRLSPYRSRASPRGKPPAFKNFARPTAVARMRQASRVLWGDILHVCHERLAQKPMILNAPTLPRGPSMSRLSRTRF
jgi:hypothetical protein